MKLAKALKVKNELVTKLQKIYEQIAKENSVSQNTVRSYDVIQLMADSEKYRNLLIDLKVKIAAANNPIMPSIISMAELKNRITMLRNIDTTNGEEHTFSSRHTPSIKQPIYTQLDIDKMIETAAASIRTIQENLDTHNYTTDIDFEY